MRAVPGLTPASTELRAIPNLQTPQKNTTIAAAVAVAAVAVPAPKPTAEAQA
jgi:hypothetical protein